jgi:hypothetical protein
LKNAGVAQNLLEVFLVLALLRVIVSVIILVVYTSIPGDLKIDVLFFWKVSRVVLCPVAVCWYTVALVADVNVGGRLVVACDTLLVCQHTAVLLR